MINLLEELHFEVQVFRDPTSSQIMDIVSTYSSEQRHEEFDTFACVLMSHGRMGKIFGSDGQFVSIISDIAEMFANCLSLKGKPKIFFVQACQMSNHRGEFLALLDCVSRANAVARASIRRPSVKCVFSETVKQINTKFCGKVAIHHISRLFFPLF